MKYLICIVCIFFAVAVDARSPGYLDGHLTIVSNQEVEATDQTQTVSTNYDEYPLIVLAEKKQIARIIADKNGNYHLELPPGKYILDAEGRTRGHLRAKPQSFNIQSNQTSRINMQIDTGVR